MVFCHPFLHQWRCFHLFIHYNENVSASLFTLKEVYLFTPLERFLFPYSPQWRCFYLLIHHSEGISTYLFTPMEVLLYSYSTQIMEVFSYPHSPQWRCFYILDHTNGGVASSLLTAMEVFLYFHSPQWRCFYTFIHCNGGAFTSPNGGLFISSFTLGNAFCVRGTHIYTFILTYNNVDQHELAMHQVVCLFFFKLFIFFLVAKLWLSHI